MKKEDLYNAIGNIDQKIIENSIAYKHSLSKQRFTKIIALAACIAVLVTAIPAALILSREDVNADAPTVSTPIDGEITDPGNDTDTKSVQIIYCDAKTAEEIKKASYNEDIEIKDISEIETDLSTKVGDIEASAEIPARLYKTIGGKDYIFNFSSAYATTLATSSNEQLKKQGSVAIYGIEGKDLGEARMEYCYETGRIVSLQLQSYSFATLINGDLTEQQALALAERDLAVLYGDDFAHTYTLERSKLESQGSENYYSIRYRRMIFGYPTDEFIVINYNLDGELISAITSNIGSFNHLEETLSVEKINKAEEEALELLGNTEIEYTYLTVDKEGNVYVYIAYTDEYTFELYYQIGGSSVKTWLD